MCSTADPCLLCEGGGLVAQCSNCIFGAGWSVRLLWHWMWRRHLFWHIPGELPCMSRGLVASAALGARNGMAGEQRPLTAFAQSLGGVCWLPVSSVYLWVSWWAATGAGGGSLGGCYCQAASCKCLERNCWCLGAGDGLPEVPSMSATEQIHIHLLGLWEVVLPA